MRMCAESDERCDHLINDDSHIEPTSRCVFSFEIYFNLLTDADDKLSTPISFHSVMFFLYLILTFLPFLRMNINLRYHIFVSSTFIGIIQHEIYRKTVLYAFSTLFIG